jgi:acyl dehydratase
MTTTLLAPGLREDALAEARAMIGKEFRIEQWNYEASRDVIRHYAWGIGDDNPLWCDPAYAAGTRHAGIVAPPTFLYGVFDAVVAPGLPDIQWFYSGSDWVFHRPLRVGEPVTAKAKLVDAREVGGKQVQRMIVQTGEVVYYDAKDEPVGRVLSHCFRVPRSTAEGGLHYERRPMPQYSEAELEKIQASLLNEYVRGADTLYWEDVTQGDEIPQIIRGPLNRLDMTCYYAGAVGTSGYKSTKLKWKYAWLAKHHPERLPNNYDPSYYAAAISPSIGHQDESVAQSELGMPNAYDNGPQRIGMMTSCITNWIGDDGEVRELSVRLKLPVIFGDINYFKGRVTGKRTVGMDALVDFEIWAENQLGQVTAKGTASVALPRRA